jgi:hypothetical protein
MHYNTETFEGMSLPEVEAAIRSFLGNHPSQTHKTLHIATLAVEPYNALNFWHGQPLEVETVHQTGFPIPHGTQVVLILVDTPLDTESGHKFCLFANYAEDKLIIADPCGWALPKWVITQLTFLLPDYDKLIHSTTSKQLYRGYTCGLWALSNAVNLAHGRSPQKADNAEQEKRYLETFWLPYIAKMRKSAVT